MHAERTMEGLAAEAASGDLQAGRDLIESLHDHLFALLHLRGILEPDMDDVAQVTVLQMYRRLGSYDPSRPFLPWFRAIVRNVTSNYWRQRARIRRRTEIFQKLVDENVPEDDEALIQMDARKNRLTECLEALGDRHKRAVELHYFQNLNSQDIGRRIGLRAAAVRQLLVRTRLILRRCIESGLAAMDDAESEVECESI